MIHFDSLNTIKKDRQDENFTYPYYGKYSIAEIVPSILSLFDVSHSRNTLPLEWFQDSFKDKNKVLFFMLDGLGLDHLQEYHEQVPFFDKLLKKTNIYPITSVFPSTTPAALTTIHTGFTPQEHGLPEWTVYFEEFDKIIETFPFRPIMTGDRETLLEIGGKPEMLYEGSTVYQQLKEKNIPSYIFTYQEYANSAYSRMSQKGGVVISFNDFTDLFVKLRETLKREKGPAYFFVYWSHIDSTQHVFGPRSPEHIASLHSFSEYITKELLEHLTPEDAKEVLYLQVADHGHTSIKGEDIIYLNEYLTLESSYLRSPSKQNIHPTGSPHDVFLHIYEPRLQEILQYLKQELEGKARVMTTHEAIEKGIFGLNEPTEKFLKRVGNLLILPYKGHHVWYKHAPTMHYGQRGIHGGLSEAEMIVPFVVGELSELL